MMRTSTPFRTAAVTTVQVWSVWCDDFAARRQVRVPDTDVENAHDTAVREGARVLGCAEADVVARYVVTRTKG